MSFIEEGELQGLLLQLKQGYEPAFNTLYQNYSKALYKKIYIIVKNEEIAEELLQDLFLKIWHKREAINHEQSFTSFLYTIAKNLVYDYLRKISKDKRLHARLFINAVDYYLQTEEALIGKETDGIIQDAIGKLSEQRRGVFILCKIQGKSYKETARELGISVSTVNSHMVKSTRFIKEYLYKNQEMSILIISGSILSICK